MAKTTMIQKSFFISYLALISSILTCECEPLENSSINGFTTDLIHRDSPDSPLYDPSSTHSQRLASAMARSRIRAKRFNLTRQGKAAESTITSSADGSYLMRFAVGSPAKPVIAIVDTGSHLTWTQCLPCNKCIPQRFAIFNPKSSSTYKTVRCDSYGCDAYAPSTLCDKRREKCLYVVNYGDNSSSHGVIAEDTLAFSSSTGRLMFFNRIVFGCGNNNYFHVNNGAFGIVGLAGGSSSLVRQLGYDKFAYCLMGDPKKSSKIHFGVDAVVSGRGVVSTPLTTPRDTYYYLTLEAITVGNKRIKYYNPYPVAGGNIIIDSGSFITYFPVNFYDEFEVALANQIEARAVRDFKDWRLCYSARFDMPKITLHFKGADVEWGFYNAFVRVGLDYVCLAVDPMEGLPLYGSVAQVNFLVGYNLGKMTLSFKRTECGTFSYSQH